MRTVLGLVLLAGCAGADAMALPPAPPAAIHEVTSGELGLNPGESMAFEVRLAGVLAGEAQLAVGQAGDFQGHRAVVVKSRAATAGAAALVKHIVDEATTTIDMDSGKPLALETLVENGEKRTVAFATFSGTVANVSYQVDDKTPQLMKIDFGKIPVHDAHSAMAQLRGFRAPAGTMRTVFVVGGRRLWRVDVTYVGEDMIGSAIGNRRAVHFTGKSYRANARFQIEGKTPARTFEVWLSDDADRVPLKVTASTELGAIAMDLTEYNR